MGKIKYLLRCIFKMDFKNMFKIAKSISQKSGHSFIYIIFDMIRSGILYQAGYYDYQEFEFYNLNKEERKTYLTRGKNNQIIKQFNDKSLFHIFENKNEFYKTFDKYINRKWLYLDGSNLKEFINFFENAKNIIVKPIDGEGGHGVEKFTFENIQSCEELYKKLITTKQLLAEEFINQHDEMNKLYPNSVNSLRMFTFYKDGQVHFMQAVLKIGNGGKVVDNFSSGGMYTYVDENGIVYAEAIDRDDNIFYMHPISHTQIVGFKVPMFDEAVKLVLDAAKVVPEIAYVGWDVAISKNMPVIIEGNCYPGVFQVKPSLTKSNKKEGLIPKYNIFMNIF